MDQPEGRFRVPAVPLRQASGLALRTALSRRDSPASRHGTVCALGRQQDCASHFSTFTPLLPFPLTTGCPGRSLQTTWTYCLLCERIYGHAYLSEQSWKLSFVRHLLFASQPLRALTDILPLAPRRESSSKHPSTPTPTGSPWPVAPTTSSARTSATSSGARSPSESTTSPSTTLRSSSRPANLTFEQRPSSSSRMLRSHRASKRRTSTLTQSSGNSTPSTVRSWIHPRPTVFASTLQRRLTRSSWNAGASSSCLPRAPER